MPKINKLVAALLTLAALAYGVFLQFIPDRLPDELKEKIVFISLFALIACLVAYALLCPIVRHRQVEDPRYDVWVHDAIWYLVYGTWDKNRTVGEVDHNENFKAIASACVIWLPQMAMEGRVPIWGKKSPSTGLFEPIPADYWSRYQIDITSWTGEPWECRTDEAVSGAHDGKRYALKTNKAIVEDMWQRYGKKSQG